MKIHLYIPKSNKIAGRPSHFRVKRFSVTGELLTQKACLSHLIWWANEYNHQIQCFMKPQF